MDPPVWEPATGWTCIGKVQVRIAHTRSHEWVYRTVGTSHPSVSTQRRSPRPLMTYYLVPCSDRHNRDGSRVGTSPTIPCHVALGWRAAPSVRHCLQGMALPRSPAELAQAVADSRGEHNAGRISIAKHLQTTREVWREAMSRGLFAEVGKALDSDHRKQHGAAT